MTGPVVVEVGIQGPQGPQGNPGSTYADLGDVDVSTLVDGQLMSWDSSDQLWKPTSPFPMPTDPRQQLVANPGIEAGYEWSEGQPTWHGTRSGTLAESCAKEATSQDYGNDGGYNGTPLFTRIWLQEGMTYSNVHIYTGYNAFVWGTGAHNQVGLFGNEIQTVIANRLRVSPDYTNTAWPENFEFTFALTSTYTPAASNWHYVCWVRNVGAGGSLARFVAAVHSSAALIDDWQPAGQFLYGIPRIGGVSNLANQTEVPATHSSEFYGSAARAGYVPYVRMT